MEVIMKWTEKPTEEFWSYVGIGVAFFLLFAGIAIATIVGVALE